MSRKVTSCLDTSKTLAVLIPTANTHTGAEREIYDMRGRGDGKVSPTLCTDHASRPSDYCPVIFQQNSRSEVRIVGGESHPISGAVTSEPGAQCQNYVFAQNQCGEVRTGNKVGTLNTNANANASGRNTPMICQPENKSLVRRLVPVECERLQGFPDNFTLIPWRKKKIVDCPDGPRYKAIGNSMAVPCMRWIGEQIQMVEDEERKMLLEDLI